MGIFNSYIKHLGEGAEGEIEKNVKLFLPQKKNLVYLDLGCNDGVKTIKRASMMDGCIVLGAEVDEQGANKAKSLGIKVYSVDLNKKWPFGGSSIDCITATEVIEHLSDLDNFFEETKRVLKTKGKIIISTENLASYHNIVALILGNQPYTGPYLSKVFPIGHKPCAKFYSDKHPHSNPHLNVMTIKALESLLQKYGFKVKGRKSVAFYPLPGIFGKLMARIDKYHASYCVFLAEKNN